MRAGPPNRNIAPPRKMTSGAERHAPPSLQTTPARQAVLYVLAAGLVLLQVLIGGARMIDALPCYAVIAAAGLGTWLLRAAAPARPNLWCLATTLALALYVAVRAAVSPVPALARPDFFMTLAALVVYLTFAIFLTATRERFTLTLILMLVAIFHVGLGILQLKNQENFMLLPWIARPDYGFRASGLFISPDHLAALLGMLTSCGSGVTVVNIDNGFGAAYAAAQINRLLNARR